VNLRPIVSGALIVGLLLVGTLGGTWGAGAAYADIPEEDVVVTNQEETANHDQWIRVAPEKATVAYDNETVTDSGGTTLSEGADYEWSTSNASIYFPSSTTSVTDGETVDIDYTYRQKPRDARALRGLVGIPINTVLPALILVALAFAIAGLAVSIRGTALRASNNRRNFGR
jgi:hypothetical protein